MKLYMYYSFVFIYNYTVIIPLIYISVIPVEDLNDTARSVSSQMGNKEMSGFTLFAKEMRILSIDNNNIFN